MKSLEDYGIAIEFKRVLERIINQRVRALRPASRLATVVSIDGASQTAQVLFPGNTLSVPVKMGTVQPYTSGGIVRVERHAGEWYITDVFGSGPRRVVPNGAGAVSFITMTDPLVPLADYPVGYSQHQVTSVAGWGTSSGTVLTFKNNSNRGFQIMHGISNNIYTRYAHSNTAGNPGGWGDWRRIYDTLYNHTTDHVLIDVFNSGSFATDLSTAQTDRADIVLSLPSTWSTFVVQCHVNFQVRNQSVAAVAASATLRQLSTQFARNGAVIGSARAHTLRNVTNEMLHYAHTSTPINGTGTQTFTVRNWLNVNDNYNISDIGFGVTAYRVN